MSKTDEAQVGFRCMRASAEALGELAQGHRHGLRGVILNWLAQAGYAEIAEHDLARPDGRRRQTLSRNEPGATLEPQSGELHRPVRASSRPHEMHRTPT